MYQQHTAMSIYSYGLAADSSRPSGGEAWGCSTRHPHTYRQFWQKAVACSLCCWSRYSCCCSCCCSCWERENTTPVYLAGTVISRLNPLCNRFEGEQSSVRARRKIGKPNKSNNIVVLTWTQTGAERLIAPNWRCQGASRIEREEYSAN